MKTWTNISATSNIKVETPGLNSLLPSATRIGLNAVKKMKLSKDKTQIKCISNHNDFLTTIDGIYQRKKVFDYPAWRQSVGDLGVGDRSIAACDET